MMRILLAWLRKFLELGATAGDATVSARRQPLGYLQYTTTGSAAKLSATTLAAAVANFPGASIGYAVIQCQGAASTDYAGWRDDGTAPTTTIGMRLFSGQELDYTGDIYNIQFITGSGSPVLNISLYA